MDFFKNATDKANEVLSNVSLFLQKDEEENIDAKESKKPEKENKPGADLRKEEKVSMKTETIVTGEVKSEKTKFSGGKKTYIAEGVTIDGNITVDGDVEIAGNLNGDIKSTGKVVLSADMTGNVSAGYLELNSCKLHGNIEVSNDVVISKGSMLEGNAKAKNLNCAGKVLGNIAVDGKATFVSGSSIDGDVSTVTLSIEENACVNGAVKMSGVKA